MRIRLISVAFAAALPSLASAQEAPAAKPPPKTVGEVVVTGQAPAVQVGIDRRSYSVAHDLQAQTGAIADALRNIPSVEVDVQGNVSLRGDPNVTILIDGKPSSQFQGDNRAQSLQQLPAESIDRVEVITNPSAEFRAEGSAGVINLISKKARGAGLTGSVRLLAGDDRYSVGASGGYNAERLSITGDLNLRRDPQKSLTTDDRLQRPTPGGAFSAVDQDPLTYLQGETATGRVALDYDQTPRTRIGLESHARYTDFRVDSPSRFSLFDASGAPSESFARQYSVHQKLATAEVSANLRQKVGADGEFTGSLTYEGLVDGRYRDGHTFNQTPPAPESFDQQRIDNHQHRAELKGDYTQNLPAMAKLKAGFDVELVDNDYRNRGFQGPAFAAQTPDPTLTNLFEFRQTISAAYATYERPVGALTVLAGLRVEDVRIHLDQVTLGQSDENGYLRAYPSLHLDWKLSDTQGLSASYSHRVQRPDPFDFNSFRFILDPLNYRSGNPDLKPQQTQSFELGYAYRGAPTVLLATLYYRENRDVVDNVLRDLGGGITLSERRNIGQGRSGGLEGVASGKLTPALSYNVSGSVTWTQLDSLGPTFAPTRSLVSASGRGTLTWQAGPNDLFQLSGFANGERLTAQGHAEPVMDLDLGYRHKFSDRLSLVMTAQDIAHSLRLRQAIDTPILIERTRTDFDTRQVRVGLTWTFGGGRQRDPGFEFQNGAGPPG